MSGRAVGLAPPRGYRFQGNESSCDDDDDDNGYRVPQCPTPFYTFYTASVGDLIPACTRFSVFVPASAHLSGRPIRLPPLVTPLPDPAYHFPSTPLPPPIHLRLPPSPSDPAALSPEHQYRPALPSSSGTAPRPLRILQYYLPATTDPPPPGEYLCGPHFGRERYYASLLCGCGWGAGDTGGVDGGDQGRGNAYDGDGYAVPGELWERKWEGRGRGRGHVESG